MKTLARYFFRGLLAVVPVGGTLYLLYWIFGAVDGLLVNLIGLFVDEAERPDWMAPGVGVLITVVLVTLVGLFASSVLTRGLFRLIELLFTHVPFVKLLYTALKDLVGAFVGEHKSFDKPVLVSLGRGVEAWMIGFVTRQDLGAIGLEEHVAVYFPQSYNFAGQLLIVPAERVQPLEAESAEVMTFIVSAGISGKGDERFLTPKTSAPA